MSAVDVKKKWESSSWGRKLIVQKRRANLNDFDRFKLMLAKIKVSFVCFLSIMVPSMILPIVLFVRFLVFVLLNHHKLMDLI